MAIIGYGNNGMMLARKLSGFELKVIAYDKYKTGFSDAFAQEVSMEQVVREADILSLHVPLSRETRQLFNDEYLFHFKKPIVLLNASRGEVVNTKAVLNGIRNGKISAAGLDVLEIEKFPALADQDWFKELSESKKVILSPHIAGWTHESYLKISEVLAQKFQALIPEL